MKATDTFRNPPFCHNCAQAVAYHWRRLYGSPDIVAAYAPFTGGRAPEGYCGALWAAMEACPDRADEIRSEFAARCGHTKCREIKSTTGTPCAVCVDTADRLVARFSAE